MVYSPGIAHFHQQKIGIGGMNLFYNPAGLALFSGFPFFHQYADHIIHLLNFIQGLQCQFRGRLTDIIGRFYFIQ